MSDNENSGSLWDAMERLRLSTIAGLDRLDAGLERLRAEQERDDR